MLRRLSIRDVVLIDSLDLDFGDGLCVLTGETGAGKSILLDALGLALGSRADAGLVRRGAGRAQVSAAFEVPANGPVADLLEEQELPREDVLVLRRALGADGRSRAFINDQAASVGLLRRLGALLVEIQGQFEQLGLRDAATHRGMLDDFGGHGPALAATGAAFAAWREAGAALAAAEDDLARARSEEAFLRDAVAELDALDAQPGEEAALGETRAMLQHSGQVLEALSGAATALEGDGGADTALQRAARELARGAGRAGGRLDAAVAAVDRALAEAAEACRLVRGAAEEVDHQEGRLDEVEERLFALRAAARRHGVDADGLAGRHAGLAARLALLGEDADALAGLAAAAGTARRRYHEAAAALGRARAGAAARLDAAVARELKPLRLDRAAFSVRVERLGEDEEAAHGRDRVTFVASTNPGSDPAPLARIASGGELSRFLLALRVALAGAGDARVLVFDEVDAGVGGATATAVGARLARLARDRQVLVVTHSPQVAALGRRHLHVSKRTGRTAAVTGVTVLSGAARREEIARMLSGRRITDEARAAAGRLLRAGAE